MIIKESFQKIVDHFRIGKILEFDSQNEIIKLQTNQGNFVLVELSVDEWSKKRSLEYPLKELEKLNLKRLLLPDYRNEKTFESSYIHFKHNYYSIYENLDKILDNHGIEMHLPFKGEWLTGSGGDSKELNHHHDVPNQKYAFDFIMIGENEDSYDKNGNRNEDYYCFSQELLSPADGEVMQVVDGVDDNIPGYISGWWTFGNTVIIKHSTNIYSVLAHFQQNSIVVKVGDKVKIGDLLGLCGNSGRSSEPHLHFHLQDRPNVLFAKSVKCYFKEVKIKNKILENYSPVRGDLIINPKISTG
jgi:hypothetical protein